MFFFKSQRLEASDSTLIFFLLLCFFFVFILMYICGPHCCGGKPENVTPKYSRGSKSIAFLKEGFLIQQTVLSDL